MHALRFWLISCTLLSLSWSQLKAQLIVGDFPSVHNYSLIQVFDSLHTRYGVRFTYDVNLLEGRQAPMVEISQKPIQEAVSLLIGRFCLQYKYQPDRLSFVIASNPKRQATIRGIVTSSEFPDGLEGGSVQLKNARRGDVTSTSGRFSFNCSCDELDTLVVTSIYHETKQIPLDPLEREVNLHNITLRYGNPTLGAVVIHEEGDQVLAVRDHGVSALIYRPHKIRQMGLGTSDVVRPLQFLPGLFAGDGSAGGISVRGSSPAQNLMTFDGITLYQTDHFFGAFGVLNSRAVREISLHRGGFDARWGGRTASVIEVQGHPNRVDSLAAGVDLNLLNATAFIEVPLMHKSDRQHAGFLVAGRFGSPTMFSTPVGQALFNQTFQDGVIASDQARNFAPGTSVNLDPNLAFGDLTARAVWRDTTRHFLLGATGFASRNRLHYQHEVQANDILEVAQDQLIQQQEGASLQWRQDWEAWRGRGTHKAVLAYSSLRTAYDYRLSSAGSESNYAEGITQLSHLTDLSLRVDHAWLDRHLHHQVEAGYFLGELHTSLDASNTYFDASTPDTTAGTGRLTEQAARLGGGYAQYSYRPDSAWALAAGLRYTYYTPTARGYLAPRASVIYRPLPRVRLKTAVGRYYQFLQQESAPNGLRVGEQYWLLANVDSIDVVSADHLIGGISLELGEDKAFLFELEAYYKRLRGLSTYSLNYNPFTTERETDQRLSDGHGRIWGVDVLVRRRVGDWYTTWISYTALVAQHRYVGFQEGAWFAANEDIRHFAKWVHIFTLGEQQQWDLSAAFSINAGLPYTDAIGVELAQNGIARDYPQVLFGPRNAARLPMRHQLDLSVAYTLTRPDGRRLGSLGLSIYNVYNQRNVSDRRFTGVSAQNPDEPPTLVVIDRYLLGILPNLFASLQF